ncbi:hypothetical protein FA95DRAFT_1208772 [Auriscalpium vulgare]|uniref:Uncharacterized protein n=1 Tax=Auriscalpium vulgare TaxID=40419 RepID=A0ACB8RVN9_9AGAM|nr:hypothetical protein FA95DRAFT_1208772 [Auriscalpium vulgare]
MAKAVLYPGTPFAAHQRSVIYYYRGGSSAALSGAAMRNLRQEHLSCRTLSVGLGAALGIFRSRQPRGNEHKGHASVEPPSALSAFHSSRRAMGSFNRRVGSFKDGLGREWLRVHEGRIYVFFGLSKTAHTAVPYHLCQATSRASQRLASGAQSTDAQPPPGASGPPTTDSKIALSLHRRRTTRSMQPNCTREAGPFPPPDARHTHRPIHIRSLNPYGKSKAAAPSHIHVPVRSDSVLSRVIIPRASPPSRPHFLFLRLFGFELYC